MKRQTASGDLLPAARSPELDPFALPVSVAHGGLPGEAGSATIDRDRVTFHRTSQSRAVPLRSYAGVAVRMTAADGNLRVAVELNHSDPSLSVVLLTAEDPADVAADWRAWSRCLGLPMLLIELDGSVIRPIPSLGSIETRSPKPRRMHSYFASRRPRFLARRKTGWQRELPAADGSEIIARK